VPLLLLLLWLLPLLICEGHALHDTLQAGQWECQHSTSVGLHSNDFLGER
jgi:hypothetical protein